LDNHNEGEEKRERSSSFFLERGELAMYSQKAILKN
jgi:hypothetical protein